MFLDDVVNEVDMKREIRNIDMFAGQILLLFDG